MRYLDAAKLDAIDAGSFRSRQPYPWVNPQGLLTDVGYSELRASLPDVAIFDRVFGRERKYGQQSHDRYALEWHEGLDLSPAWQAFIGELRGREYAAFLRRILGVAPRLRFHWHYTPRGCSVSPHCDAKRKIGSHVFYFNDREDWDPAWGGETLILDDRGRFESDSSPAFEDFETIAAAESLDNRSLIFLRRGNSWHGVREITCPEDQMRKVFIVVFELPGVLARVRRLVGLDAAASA